jgi:hypothetical protein
MCCTDMSAAGILFGRVLQLLGGRQLDRRGLPPSNTRSVLLATVAWHDGALHLHVQSVMRALYLGRATCTGLLR